MSYTLLGVFTENNNKLIIYNINRNPCPSSSFAFFRFFFLLLNHIDGDPGEAVHPGEAIIHPCALLAVVDPGDFAGAAVEKRIIQADFVADLENCQLPHGAVLAQQAPREIEIPVGERPSVLRIADAADDPRDPAEGREILKRRFAEQEHIPGQQVVGTVDVLALHPGALDDLRRERAVRDAAVLQQVRDGPAPLGFTKQTVGVHPVSPLSKNGKASPGEGR